MGVLFLKSFYHIIATIQKLFWKFIYMRKIHFGKHVTWRSGFKIYIDGGDVTIGNNCFFNHGCSITSIEGIEVGEGCIFGENVKIYDHNHRFSNRHLPIKDQGYTKAPVVIGSHCWVGSNVTILKGATIGSNCVISAGVVVKGSIPDNTLVSIRREYEYREIRH